MKQMTYVCVYTDYLESLEHFSMEERGRLLTAMLEYARTGETPEFTGNERFIWNTIRGQMDRDRKVYEERCARNRANGRKGGRPSKAAVLAAEAEEEAAEETVEDEEEAAEEEETETPEQDPEETEGLFPEAEETDRFFLKPKKPKEKEKKKKNTNTNTKERKQEKKKEKTDADEAAPDLCADAPFFLSSGLKKWTQEYETRIRDGTANEIDETIYRILLGVP